MPGGSLVLLRTILIFFATLMALVNAAASLAGIGRRGMLSGTRREQLQLSPGVADCRNGWELFRALANQSVDHIRILADLEVYDADWSTSMAPLPIIRNITLEGANRERDQWLILDMNFVEAKVQLSAGVWVTFTRLVLVNAKAAPNFQAPGIDLFAPVQLPSAASGSSAAPSDGSDVISWPGILLEDVALIHRTCLPIAGISELVRKFPRPPVFPGNQTSRFGLPQNGCVNNCTARPMARCWPMRGVYDDMAASAYNMGGDGIPREAGYTVRLWNAYVICATVMDEECVARANSYIGCFNYMFPPNSTAAAMEAGPGACSGSRADPGGSGEGGHLRGAQLGAILGGVLGGVALLAAVAAFAVLGGWRSGCFRRGAQQSKDPLADDDGDGAAQQQQQQQHRDPPAAGGGPGQQATAAAGPSTPSSTKTVTGGEEW